MSMSLAADRPTNPTLYLAYGVRMHRAEFGITIEEAAGRAGVSVERWAELETGARIPSVEEIDIVINGLRGASLWAVAFWAYCSRNGVDALCHCHG